MCTVFSTKTVYIKQIRRYYDTSFSSVAFTSGGSEINRCFTRKLFKDRAEICMRFITAQLRDLRNCQICCCKQLACFFHSYEVDIFGHRHSGILSELTAHIFLRQHQALLCLSNARVYTPARRCDHHPAPTCRRSCPRL